MDRAGKLTTTIVAGIVYGLVAVTGGGWIAATHLVKVYGDSSTHNAGIVVGTDQHNIGYEWRDNDYPDAVGWFVNNN